MKTKTKLTLLSLSLAMGLSASSLHAKTLDPALVSIMQQAPAGSLHQVIITFDQQGAPHNSQLNMLSSMGISGVSLHNLPIVGAVATAEQIQQIYARNDVLSVWHNAPMSLENNESTAITGVQQLRADQSLRSSGMPFSGRGIGVVVNDSGVDGSHPDIRFPNHTVQNVLAQTNLNSFSGILPITYQENVENTDIAGGHGSHVAGIIGANGAQSSGKYAGVAPGAKIIGYGSGAGLFILDTLGGFDYALTHQYDYNIRVISNSFGNTGDVGTPFNPDDPTNVATKALSDNGVIVVFSAGNSGSGESTITGNFKKAPWVVTVAAGDKSGALASFSSRGTKGNGGQVEVGGEMFNWVDEPTITAPGVDVVSVRASLSSLSALSLTDDSEIIEPQHLPYYTLSSGTSMSAPHISGVVALMLEANPNLNWRDVKRILRDTATNMSGRESWEVGAGYVNAHAAVQAARAMDNRFGDTVKQNRQFNAKALTSIAASFTQPVNFNPVGELEVETFEVDSSISLVSVKARVSDNTVALVLEDPNGKRYGSGVALPVLGENIGLSAAGVAGTWKIYVRGVGGLSGVALDPLGVTNGFGIPDTINAQIKLVRTDGYVGLGDVIGHPAQGFIEYAVAEQLMDGFSYGFDPDSKITKAQLADTMVLAGAVRQSNKGDQLNYTDTNGDTAAAANAVTMKGAALKDLGFAQQPVVKPVSSSKFGVNNKVTRAELAYSLVQTLAKQADAANFNPASNLKVFAFNQWIDVADSALISPELKGYVQKALDLGLMHVQFSLTQGPFDAEPVIKAHFSPNETSSRAALAMSLTTLHQLMAQ
ncbi:S8 family serine peptidase [Rheinheimera sp. UJ51]|uniref:S8 family serine peptidase n=1 Tax=Rheinheimera sp. UJ51 TaxID=2892446 RepID=UPI001E476967|nr:S8 family serine peptidase [Rheinheimera sp. UJ51]MCC5452033.1 S8 family serine peptidase [Rheinheimera sp. UJ51]